VEGKYGGHVAAILQEVAELDDKEALKCKIAIKKLLFSSLESAAL